VVVNCASGTDISVYVLLVLYRIFFEFRKRSCSFMQSAITSSAPVHDHHQHRGTLQHDLRDDDTFAEDAPAGGRKIVRRRDSMKRKNPAYSPAEDLAAVQYCKCSAVQCSAGGWCEESAARDLGWCGGELCRFGSPFPLAVIRR